MYKYHIILDWISGILIRIIVAGYWTKPQNKLCGFYIEFNKVTMSRRHLS